MNSSLVGSLRVVGTFVLIWRSTWVCMSSGHSAYTGWPAIAAGKKPSSLGCAPINCRNLFKAGFGSFAIRMMLHPFNDFSAHEPEGDEIGK